jgi:glucose-1-phosphate thymidylyltransferase
MMVACLEEIAYRQGYITNVQLCDLARQMGSSGYGQYLRRIVEQDF